MRGGCVSWILESAQTLEESGGIREDQRRVVEAARKLALILLAAGGSYNGLIAGCFVLLLDRNVHMGDRNGWVNNSRINRQVMRKTAVGVESAQRICMLACYSERVPAQVASSWLTSVPRPKRV
jgi:hypothetical protein